MKAAVVHQFGEPLVIEDRPVPEPGPGQITVRMEASGLCHTDIHAAHGDWPVKPTPPFVPGHEGVGTVHAIGAGVTGVAAGEVVAVPWLGYACGTPEEQMAQLREDHELGACDTPCEQLGVARVDHGVRAAVQDQGAGADARLP